MPAPKIRNVAIADLKVSYYVRKQLDQDNVLRLAELYAAGVEIDPLWITPDNEIIDGRHRKEAADLADVKFVPCIVKAGLAGAELVSEALRANSGGALPASREDIQFTIEQLITKYNVKGTALQKHLSFLPAAVVRKYYNQAISHVMRLRLKAAMDDIALRGKTLHEAAALHNVKVETLQQAMGNKKGSKNPVGSEESQWKQRLTSKFKGQSMSLGKTFVQVLDEYSDREIPEQAVRNILEHCKRLVTRMMKVVTDYEGRFQALQSGELPDMPQEGDDAA